MDIQKKLNDLKKEYSDLLCDFLSEVQLKYGLFTFDSLEEVKDCYMKDYFYQDPLMSTTLLFLESILCHINTMIKGFALFDEDDDDLEEHIKMVLNFALLELKQDKKDWKAAIEKCHDAIWSLNELTELCLKYIEN